MGVFGEILIFLWQRKLWWMIPMVVVLLSFGMLLMFGALILFSSKDVIEPTIAFTLFIALRMIGQVYSGFSSGLMRYVRARVYCE